MSNDEPDLEKRVAELEERVAALEEQQSNEPDIPTDAHLDHYDKTVFAELQEREEQTIGRAGLRKLYSDAGVLKKKTFKTRVIKTRVKRLERIDVLEKIPNKAFWRVKT